MAKGTRFAYLIEFDDVTSLESVSTGTVGLGVKNSNLYLKFPNDNEFNIPLNVLRYHGDIVVADSAGLPSRFGRPENVGLYYLAHQYSENPYSRQFYWRSTSQLFSDINSEIATYYVKYSNSSQTVNLNAQDLVNVANLRVGLTTSDTTTPFHLLMTSSSGSALVLERVGSYQGGAAFLCRKARGTVESKTVPSDDDICGGFISQVWDSSAWRVSSAIRGNVDGTVSSGSAPGKLIFQTTPSGSTTVVDRMTIKNDGKIGINTSSPASLLHVYHPTDAADVYISSNRTSVGRFASFNLKDDNSGNYFRFTWRSYTQDNVTSNEVIQTVFDAENTLWRQLLRFRLVNRMLYFGEDALTTSFFSPSNGFGVASPTERVDVDGNVKATGFKVGSDAGVDASSGTLKAVTVKKGIITAATSVTPVADGTHDLSSYRYIQTSGGIITAFIE